MEALGSPTVGLLLTNPRGRHAIAEIALVKHHAHLVATLVVQLGVRRPSLTAHGGELVTRDARPGCALRRRAVRDVRGDRRNLAAVLLVELNPEGLFHFGKGRRLISLVRDRGREVFAVQVGARMVIEGEGAPGVKVKDPAASVKDFL